MSLQSQFEKIAAPSCKHWELKVNQQVVVSGLRVERFRTHSLFVISGSWVASESLVIPRRTPLNYPPPPKKKSTAKWEV